MRGPDVGTKLARALVSMAGDAGCAIQIVNTESNAWASATFSGARHRLLLRSEDIAFADWLGGLPDAEFALNGHLVADITIDSIHRENGRYDAEIAALTLIEG